MFKLIMLSLCSVLGNTPAPMSDMSSANSGHVNFTLSQTNNSASVILEIWNEIVTAPNGKQPQRLNGKLYLINQNIYS